MQKNRRPRHAAWFSALLIAPALLANCNSSGPLSLGDPNAGLGNAGLGNAGLGNAGLGNAGLGNAGLGNAGLGNAGLGNAGLGNAGSAGSGGSTGLEGGSGGADAGCPTSACGPALGLPSYQCADGSLAGPTGHCLKRDNGTCGWEIRSCPSGSGGAGGAGGHASGGASGQLCGGHVCGVDQLCCGPNECGICISKFSGAFCPTQCAGGSGGAGSGGGSGGAGGADCTSLLANVDSTFNAASVCNPAAQNPELECTGRLGDCCPVPVNAATGSVAYQNAQNALNAYKQSCLPSVCNVSCPVPPAPVCVAVPGSTLGMCGG
jgi:PPE-repeat protein